MLWVGEKMRAHHEAHEGHEDENTLEHRHFVIFVGLVVQIFR
jgi:hypothetical protein